jgi:MEMO1 family protein
MIIYSAIVPHSPVLIPNIGKENLESLKKTSASVKQVNFNLYNLVPDTVIIFSPNHNSENQGKININQSEKFLVDFEGFGDFETKKNIKGDMKLAYQIHQHFETDDSLNLIHEEKIDHGAGIPAFLLNQEQKEISVLPIFYGNQSIKHHFEFGQKLFEFLQTKNKRIAILGSGDLAHQSQNNKSVAKKLDRLIFDLIKRKKYEKLFDIEENNTHDVEICGLRAIAMLAGIMSRTNHQTNILSYEAPLDVGYLVAEFTL